MSACTKYLSKSSQIKSQNKLKCYLTLHMMHCTYDGMSLIKPFIAETSFDRLRPTTLCRSGLHMQIMHSKLNFLLTRLNSKVVNVMLKNTFSASLGHSNALSIY